MGVVRGKSLDVAKMNKLPLFFFFISAFLISRLLIKVNLPQRIVSWLVFRKPISLPTITFYLLGASAFLSFIIPNAITVLTLLPIMAILKKAFDELYPNNKSLSSLISLSVIYGANIGGMGSVTATPANGIFIGALKLNNIEAIEQVSFAGWLVWGIPLVTIFILIAWLLLSISFNAFSKQYKNIDFQQNRVEGKQWPAKSHFEKLSIYLTVSYFIIAFGTSALVNIFPSYIYYWVAISGLMTTSLVIFLFIIPIYEGKGTQQKKSILRIKDLYSGLPRKGVVLLLVVTIIGAILYAVGIKEIFTDFVRLNIPTGFSVTMLLLVIALFTTFSTELLSNTVVQLSMFAVIISLAEATGLPLVVAMLIATLSSTCAFMSPLATAVNGLAFGGVHGVSLKRMLTVGFLMNIAGAFVITYWVPLFISN